MANGDPVINCALLICCPPLSQESEKAVASLLVSYGGLDEATAKRAAPAVQKCFDLAEKGTLQPLKDSIARLARGADFKG